MLLATELERVFILKENGNDIILSDPDPNWSEQAVMNYYSGEYPILTTSKVSFAQISNDTAEYRFETLMGTKG